MVPPPAGAALPAPVPCARPAAPSAQSPSVPAAPGCVHPPKTLPSKHTVTPSRAHTCSQQPCVAEDGREPCSWLSRTFWGSSRSPGPRRGSGRCSPRVRGLLLHPGLHPACPAGFPGERFHVPQARAYACEKPPIKLTNKRASLREQAARGEGLSWVAADPKPGALPPRSASVSPPGKGKFYWGGRQGGCWDPDPGSDTGQGAGGAPGHCWGHTAGGNVVWGRCQAHRQGLRALPLSQEEEEAAPVFF